MKTTTDMEAIIAWLDVDSIEIAGFNAENITQDQFNLIKGRLERYVDANWTSLIHDACEGVLSYTK